jgi:hypothetical protein
MPSKFYNEREKINNPLFRPIDFVPVIGYATNLIREYKLEERDPSVKNELLSLRDQVGLLGYNLYQLTSTIYLFDFISNSFSR